MAGLREQAPETRWELGAELQELRRALAETKLDPSLEETGDWRSHQNLGPNRQVQFQQHLARRPSSDAEFYGGALDGRRHKGGSPESSR